MARILFFTILAMCLVCLIQASPVPGQDQQPNIVNDVVNAFTAAGETVKKGFEDVANDPAVKKVLSEAAQALQQSLNAASEQINKLAPKTA